MLTLGALVHQLAQNPQNLTDLANAIQNRAGKAMTGWPQWSALDPQNQQTLVTAIQNADTSFLDSFPTMNVAQLKDFILWYGDKQGPVKFDDPEPPASLSMSGAQKNPPDGAFLKDVGHGFYHGDLSLDGQPTAYSDNVEFAAILNRLALNDPAKPSYQINFQGQNFATVSDFLGALAQSSHTITAKDMRMFANFGGLWYKQNDQWVSVITPLYVDTGLLLPDGNKVTVPIAHSQLELIVSGPIVNTDVIYYLGVGGSANFSAKATEEKPWVDPTVHHIWQGENAIRLAERAAVTRRELKFKVDKYHLPLGGYGRLGACTDIEAMIIENPIYPEVRDMTYYSDGDPQTAEIDAWAHQLPVDSAPAQNPHDPDLLKRVYDSLPTHNPDDIAIIQTKTVVSGLNSLPQNQNSPSR